MIKIIIVILILFISFSIITSLINRNKFFYKLPKKFLYSVLILLVLAFLVFFRVINNKKSNGNYIPAKVEGTVIIPGKVQYDK
jgi:predicted tellurium resistance membrane protein TerC